MQMHTNTTASGYCLATFFSKRIHWHESKQTVSTLWLRCDALSLRRQFQQIKNNLYGTLQFGTVPCPLRPRDGAMIDVTRVNFNKQPCCRLVCLSVYQQLHFETKRRSNTREWLSDARLTTIDCRIERKKKRKLQLMFYFQVKFSWRRNWNRHANVGSSIHRLMFIKSNSNEQKKKNGYKCVISTKGCRSSALVVTAKSLCTLESHWRRQSEELRRSRRSICLPDIWCWQDVQRGGKKKESWMRKNLGFFSQRDRGWPALGA